MQRHLSLFIQQQNKNCGHSSQTFSHRSSQHKICQRKNSLTPCKSLCLEGQFPTFERIQESLSFLLQLIFFQLFFFLKYPLLINSILSILSKDSKFPQYICIQFYCFVLDILLCKCSRHFLVNTMFLSPKLYSKLLNNKNHALPPTWVFFFFLYYDCIKPINLF